MTLGEIEPVRADLPLDKALAAAFERVRDSGASQAALLFPLEWAPTMDIVAIVADELERCEDLTGLTLIHPSAAMTFIASAIGLRAERVEVRTQRSVHDDDDEEEDTDATASRTMFVMRPDDRAEAFVRKSVTEAKNRLVRRFALVFDPKREPPLELADILAEELLHGGVKRSGSCIRAPRSTPWSLRFACAFPK
jgi:hypothetical protein